MDWGNFHTRIPDGRLKTSVGEINASSEIRRQCEGRRCAHLATARRRVHLVTARRRVHVATVLFRPPFGHRPSNWENWVNWEMTANCFDECLCRTSPSQGSMSFMSCSIEFVSMVVENVSSRLNPNACKQTKWDDAKCSFFCSQIYFFINLIIVNEGILFCKQ